DGARPGRDGAFADGEAGIGHDERGVDARALPEAVAVGAHPERAVEGEALRRELAEGVAAAGARLAEAEVGPARIGRLDAELAIAVAERELDGLGDARAVLAADQDAIDDELDGVLLLLVELWRLVEAVHRAVGARADEALGGELGVEVAELALPVHDDRREDLEARALAEGEEVVDDLLARAALHLLAAEVAVLDARPRV